MNPYKDEKGGWPKLRTRWRVRGAWEAPIILCVIICAIVGIILLLVLLAEAVQHVFDVPDEHARAYLFVAIVSALIVTVTVRHFVVHGFPFYRVTEEDPPPPDDEEES